MEQIKNSANSAETPKTVKKAKKPRGGVFSHPFSLLVRLLVYLSAFITVGILIFIIAYILVMGVPNLIQYADTIFEWKYTPENVSMMPAIINTLLMTALTLIMAVPIGIFSAIYLVEYAKRGSKLVKIIRLTTETLSGIPSIVFGLFGFLAFVTFLHWKYSMLAGSITLAIMVLPLIIRTTEEALLAVPDTYREGSFGLGAGKLRTIFKIILPSAMPGILSGVILAIGRISGETAALIFTAGTSAGVSANLFQPCRTLAVHMYCLLSEGLYTGQAYATAVVLLIMVILINCLSSLLAKKLSTK